MVGTLTMPFYGTELEGGGSGVLVCGGGGVLPFQSGLSVNLVVEKCVANNYLPSFMDSNNEESK